MEEDELQKTLESLKRPEFSSETHKQQLKLTLLNARRTAWWGTLLIILPATFLLAVFLKYGLGIGFVFDPLDRFIFAPVRESRYKLIEPLLLFVVPLFALIVNVIAVTHFSVHREAKEVEITISIKRRWWNWIVIGVSALIVSIIFLYVVRGDK